MRKKLGLFSLGILTILIFMNFVAGAISFTDSVTSITLTPQKNVTTFTLTSNYSNTTFSLPSEITLTDGTTSIRVSFSSTDSTNVQNVIYTATAIGNLNNFDFGKSDSSNVRFNISNSSNPNINATKFVEVIFSNNDFCERIYNPGRLKVTIEDIIVEKGFGDDDNYWYLFDEIEVEVLVENNFNFDLRNVEVSWELHNTNGRRISSGELDTFNLRDGNDEVVHINFVLDENIDEFERENAILHVRAVGEIDDDSDNPYDGEDTCGYYTGSRGKNVEVRTDEDFVITTNFMVNNQRVEDVIILECGQTLNIRADVFNIGDENQDDVYVEVYLTALGIYERFDFEEIRAFENEEINFNFVVPRNLEQRSYSLAFGVYDEGNDLFENREDDRAETFISMKGAENCEVVIPTLNAQLDGEAVAGREIVIKANIKNNDPQNRTFLINMEGHESWATIKSINPEFVQLNYGENAEIEFVLNLGKDLKEQNYLFDIIITSEGEKVLVQPITIAVKEDKFFNFERIIGKFDWKLWGIILLNAVLLFAIIILTIRILKKK